jgi:hypothetical protein
VRRDEEERRVVAQRTKRSITESSERTSGSSSSPSEHPKDASLEEACSRAVARSRLSRCTLATTARAKTAASGLTETGE